jgi:RNA polymerase sigma-70 factor, ECF subfamily
MTVVPEPDTEQLFAEAAAGDAQARNALLARHQQPRRDLIALRMDRRLAARVDPSDVVQETLIEAAQQMSNYLKRRPLHQELFRALTRFGSLSSFQAPPAVS